MGDPKKILIHHIEEASQEKEIPFSIVVLDQHCIHNARDQDR